MSENKRSESFVDLSQQLLLAMPGKVMGSLANTVIYICEHTDQGALGLVINRPTDLTVGDLLKRLDLPLSLEIGPRQEAPVFFGGPVQTDRGFVLHRPVGDWHSTLAVSEEVGLTSSRDILQSLGERGEPHEVLVSLGYAGWSAGQLEEELAANAWLTVPAELSIIFELPPEERFAAALQQLGVDFTHLSEVAGHA